MSSRPPQSQREALDRRAKQVLERLMQNESLLAAARESLDSLRRGEKAKPYRELVEELHRRRQTVEGV